MFVEWVTDSQRWNSVITHRTIVISERVKFHRWNHHPPSWQGRVWLLSQCSGAFSDDRLSEFLAYRTCSKICLLEHLAWTKLNSREVPVMALGREGPIPLGRNTPWVTKKPHQTWDPDWTRLKLPSVPPLLWNQPSLILRIHPICCWLTVTLSQAQLWPQARTCDLRAFHSWFMAHTPDRRIPADTAGSRIHNAATFRNRELCSFSQANSLGLLLCISRNLESQLGPFAKHLLCARGLAKHFVSIIFLIAEGRRFYYIHSICVEHGSSKIKKLVWGPRTQSGGRVRISAWTSLTPSPKSWDPLGPTAASGTWSVIAEVQPSVSVHVVQVGRTGSSWHWS